MSSPENHRSRSPVLGFCCWTIALTAWVGFSPSAGAQDYQQRLSTERTELQAELLKICPERQVDIEALAKASNQAQRLAALTRLQPCGRNVERFHLQLSASALARGKFAQAEASAKKALAIRVTESGQLSLLMALVRQDELSAAQQEVFREHLRYFERRTCSRDDLCAALAFVAWHAEDLELTRRASGRAIELGFKGWQPYLYGGSAWASGAGADPKKAIEWLTEAKKRGAPANANIDAFLKKLGSKP